ncbi:hypothetical protein P0L94_15215 [Microbacter sp. GSS18]|nr:hypothetical protein P0L94_15215 [Microbacter sp. GSS18]
MESDTSLNGILGPRARLCRRALTGEHGVSLPPIVDHHVHLHLFDEQRLAARGVAAVLDLGGDPELLARRDRDTLPHAAYAGAFLTAPGGYPSGRSWAPAGIVREVRDPSLHPGVPAGAATAVDEQVECSASVVKVALNADAGPVFDAQTLEAIVASAHEHRLPVVAHVQGAGMLDLALDARVDALAHAPFSEWVDGRAIARAIALRQRWISTLSIHDGADRERARMNLEVFAHAGGHVLYGTDLGNGERPVGVDADELAALDAAGIRGADLVAMLTEPWLPSLRTTAVATFVPGPPPTALAAVPDWLSAATVVPAEDLVHDEE